MARRSLRPQLNQIRSWVREGRTDAWIAHQLEVTVKDIDAFKRDHGLAPEAVEGEGDSAPGGLDGDVDMRAEDDALVAAELDAMSEGDETAEAESDEDEGEDEEESAEGEARPRRRGRRGGRRRGRRGGRRALEGTFDHGDEGFGLWLDPAIQDDAIYAEHWAGHRPVTVAIEPDRIVIRRGGDGEPSGESAGD